LTQRSKDPVFETRLGILKRICFPKNTVVLPYVKVKFIAFTAHKNHWQVKAVCETSFVINTTPATRKVGSDET